MPWGKHVLANGTRVAPDNVLVIRAKQHYGKIYPGGGGAEPIHDIIKTKGTFYYFHGGRYVYGTWTKGAVNELFQFTVSDGTPAEDGRRPDLRRAAAVQRAGSGSRPEAPA